jgi:hypothetical protein
MAARENQGLQITLIVFVMFTIILSVTTFIFYNNYKEQVAKAKASDDQAKQAAERERTIQDERNSLAMKLGFPETDKKEEIESKANAEIKKYLEFFALNVPENQRNYTKLVDEMAKTIEGKNQELAKAKQANDDLNKQLKDNDANWAKTLATHEADKQKAVDAEKANQTSYTNQIAELNKTVQQAMAQVAQKEQAYQTLKSQAEAEVKKLRDEVKQAQTTIENKQNLITGLTEAAPTVPDGRIAWVNQRENTVFVNLGSDDGLQRRVSFSVYDRNATDAATAVKKGSIEILNIRGPHLAEARIMESTNSDPMVPGDIVYTPIWDPGQTQHFAFVGFIDFDDDGISDRAKLRDLIAHNGGIVDAEMDEKGTVTGSMSYRTQYLILGKAPTEKDSDKLREGFTQLSREAKTNGVPTVKLDAFLTQVGYSARIKGATTANTSGPRDLRATNSSPDGTKTSGQSFRTRRPPTKNADGGF